jgi:peptide/nickel transport system substrate-binding protein
MRRFGTMAVGGLGALLACAAHDAFAQKSRDTLRVPMNEPIQAVSPYYTSHPGVYLFNGVYEGFVEFNPRTGKIEPSLAKEYRRPEPGVLEFDLREDVVFHSGKKFDADDVVSIISWLKDPNTKLRHIEETEFIVRAEKLGPYKVRLHMTKPVATDLSALAYSVKFYDSTIHSKLADRSEYDRNIMVGTGPYRIVQRDVNKGTIAAKYPGYVGADWKKPQIGTIHGLTIPDDQTRIANLLTGAVDVVGDLTGDQVNELKKDSRFKQTASPGMQIYYLQLDAIGRSGRRELTDPRVRKAIFMAIDREGIIKALMPGAEMAEAPNVFCHMTRQIGCAHTASYPKYDPEGAKKLLAEAGYPNGFELIVDSSPPEVKAIGEAIAGQLYKVGITARHMPLVNNVYRDWQRDGKLEAHVAPWTMAPDVARSLNRFFTLGGQTDMFNDKMLADLRIQGAEELDPQKRAAIHAKLYDRVIEQSYILPLSSVPNVFVHSREVSLNPGAINGWGADLWDFSWN